MTHAVVGTAAPGWSTHANGTRHVQWSGQCPAHVLDVGWDDVDAANRALRAHRGLFGFIGVSNGGGFAAVDGIRSRPVFYAHGDGRLAVGSDARAVAVAAGADAPAPQAVLECSLTGYVTGRETLRRGLYQLQSGESLSWSPDAPLRVERWRRYVPAPVERSRAVLLEELAEVHDAVFDRLADHIDGRPVWVPLSGGLDSRFVLAALAQRDQDLRAFSYGPPSNHEAKVAAAVARDLGVPWFMVDPLPRRAAHRLLNGPAMRAYHDGADGLSSVPSMMEFEPFWQLRHDGRLGDDAVVVNGQTGDFLTGGHLPDELWSATAPSDDDLADAVWDHHYLLWTHLRTDAARDTMRRRVLELVAGASDDASPRVRALAAYESWEYQERQAKYVVNGQRLYDYLGLDWHLPLWDPDLVDFWETAPLEAKHGQSLYREWLCRWDPAGVFSRYPNPKWRWRRTQAWIPWTARALGIVRGQEAKALFYRRLEYFGRWSDQYARYPYRRYLRGVRSLRNPVSLAVAAWLQEEGLAHVEEG